MCKARFTRQIRWALAFYCVLTSGAHAGLMTRECAIRDLQVLMLIEAHENIGSARAVANAMSALMQARIICHEGDAGEALALYDSIAQDMITNSLHSEWWADRPSCGWACMARPWSE